MKTVGRLAKNLVVSLFAFALNVSMFSSVRSRKDKAVTSLRLALVLFLFPIALTAQIDTGRIYGVVADSTGAVVPGANVTVTNESTGVSRKTSTGSDGHYEVTELRVGIYTVTIEKEGFKTHTRRGVTAAVTETTRVDVTLEVGDLTQRVEVQATAIAAVETRDSTLGGVIEQRRIVEMPLNGRDFIQLSYFVPGVTVNYRPFSLKGSPVNVPGGLRLMPFVNGMRNTMNAVLIDGAANNDPVLNTAAIVPVPDAIEEFKIQTNLYSPEFGQGGGSVISIATKSGGNAFHGAAYYFGRNEAFDARNFFLPQKPNLRRHQFGVAAGGPVKVLGLGEKTFFFTTYEGLRLNRGLILNSLVPSLAQRAGDFSSLSTSLRDPIGGCITGKVINRACMDPVAVRLINRLWPEPNVGSTGFQASPLLNLDRNQFLIKLDHNAERHNVSGRYVIDDGIEKTPVAGIGGAGVGTGSGVPGFSVTNPSRFQNMVLGDTFLISPRLVNVSRFAYLRVAFGANLLVNRDNPADVGFTYPVLEFPSLPGFTVSGFAAGGAPTGNKDFTKRNNIFVWGDSLSYERGSHSLRFGGELRRARSDVNSGQLTPGSFTFTGVVTGNGFADYLLGAPSSTIQTGGDAERNFRSLSYDLFVQDSYKVRPSFTFNYGVRWEVFGPFRDPHIFRVGHPRLATFIPGQQSTWASDLPLGIVLAGFDRGVRETIVATDLNNFAPRIGFAWDPSKTGKTSIRGGYGIFFDATVLDGVINSTDGTPSIRPALSVSNPGPGTLADPYRGRSPLRTPLTFPIPTTTTLSPTIVGPDQRTGYSQQWNLTVQREIPGKMLSQIGYVGTKGTKLTGQRNQNQACLASVAKPCNGLTTNTLANQQARRPYQGLINLNTVVSEFDSTYHGLQTGLTRRMDKGLAFQLSYTWSKAIDYGSTVAFYTLDGQLGLQNHNDRKADRGLAAFDARHRIVSNLTYQLPLARKATGRVKQIAGDWQINGILTLQSGSPFTVFDSTDRSLTAGRGDRPDVICDPNLPTGQRTVQRWFDTACFQQVPQGVRFGTAGRNIVFADGISTFDFSLVKPIPISERTKFEFRAEFFNLFNHPDFGIGINDFSSGAFGRVLATSVEERQIQFALKFIF